MKLYTTLISVLLSASAYMLCGTAAAQVDTTAWTDAEVRRIDTVNKRITLKHGEIKNLDMPPMSMVFSVKDESMLATVKAGDTILFTADKVDGKYVVTGIKAKP